MDLIGGFKRNDFGNMLFFIHLSEKISWFLAILALTFIFCRSTACLYVFSPYEVVKNFFNDIAISTNRDNK